MDSLDITQLLYDSGIPESSLILLLMIPIVVTIVAFARHVIGLKVFGIFTASMLTFAYYELGTKTGINTRSDFVTGIKYGLVLTFIILIATLITHKTTRRIRLHYLPKLSIVITITSFVVMFTLLFGGVLRRIGFVAVDIFPVFIISMISEDFIRAYNKSSARGAYEVSFQTILLAVVSYALISWEWLINTMLTYPWLTFFAIVINIGIGRFTGLRLTEHFRFRDILTRDEAGTTPEK